MQWKPEWIDRLKGHLAASLSAKAAAIELNGEFGTRFTRCSVIGRARRSGFALISGSKGGIKSTKVKRPRLPRKAASRPKPVTAPFVPRPDPRPGQVPLLELVPDGCRWPSGEGAAMLFCNEPQEPGQVYCSEHCCLAYRLPEPRRQRN